VHGEEPVLFVSLNSCATISTDGLPKNPVGKIDKPTLRKSIAENR
jgi:hypothetical protein